MDGDGNGSEHEEDSLGSQSNRFAQRSQEMDEACGAVGQEEGRKRRAGERWRRTIPEKIQAVLDEYHCRDSRQLETVLYKLQMSDVFLSRDYNTTSQHLVLAHRSRYVQTPWKDFLDWDFDLLNPDCNFLPVSESVAWFERIMHHNDIDPEEFVQNVYRIVEKRLPKKNSIFLFGAPNAGKTLLANSIARSVHFSSTLSNMQGRSSFELQDMMYSRVAVFNEPQISNNSVELLKNVTEGNTVTIDVKFKSGQSLPRTPIICTTNTKFCINCNNAEIHSAAFRARSFTYTLTPFSSLKDCSGDLHPQMWKELIDRYVSDDI